MSSNELVVFGLSYSQQDSRKMQRVLRHYGRAPDNPGSRAALFAALSGLARELDADEAAHDQIQQLTSWLREGGEFPAAGLGGLSRRETHDTPAQEVLSGAPAPISAGEPSYMDVPYGPDRTLDGAVVPADLHGVSGANSHGDGEEDINMAKADICIACGGDHKDEECTMRRGEFGCIICCEEYPDASYFPNTSNLTATELCDHTDKACLDCMCKSIASTVSRGEFVCQLACLICKQKLSPQEIVDYTCTEVFQRYC